MQAVLVVQVTIVKTVGTGAHRKQVKTKKSAYRVTWSGTANAHGVAAISLHVTYKTKSAVKAQITVTSRGSLGTSTRSASVTIKPASTTAKKAAHAAKHSTARPTKTTQAMKIATPVARLATPTAKAAMRPRG